MDDGLFMQIMFLPFIIIFALYVAFIGVDGKPPVTEDHPNGEENGSSSQGETTESSP